MGRLWRIRLFRRRRRQYDGFLLAAAAGIGIAILVIALTDAALRPSITTLASVRAEQQVTSILNDAVEDTLEAQGLTYADLVTIEKDQQGRITLLTVDSLKLNRLRVEILERVLNEVTGLDTQDLGIRFGSLTGFATASGWGPVLPVQVLTAAVPQAVFSNRFTAQGINQTLHQIYLDVTVDITLLIPGGQSETTVSAQVCMAETLLLGQIPDTYLELSSAGGTG